MTESQATEIRRRGGKAFAKISNLIPATSMFSQATQGPDSKMGIPRFCTHIPGGTGTVYSKVPPIGSRSTESARTIRTSVSPRQIQIELEGQHDPSEQDSDRMLEGSINKSKVKEEATALAYNIMALDRHDLDLIASAVQKSDFYVNAGKQVFMV